MKAFFWKLSKKCFQPIFKESFEDGGTFTRCRYCGAIQDCDFSDYFEKNPEPHKKDCWKKRWLK